MIKYIAKHDKVTLLTRNNWYWQMISSEYDLKQIKIIIPGNLVILY